VRLVFACLLFLLALAAPASASTCTVTWTGGAGTTSWGTAGNWSGGAVPTSSDSACLASGATVVVNGSYTVGSVAGPDAHLTASGTLTLADAATPSQVGDLGVSGGLAGAGSIEATHTFSWTGGTLSGTGDTVIATGATGTLAPGSQTLDGRTLTNHGTTTWTTGNLTGRNNARFVNDGTFHANADNAYISLYSTGSATFTNSGTLDKTAGTGSTSFYLPVTNTGTANGSTGTLYFGGGGGGDGGSWTGKINLASGTFNSAAMTLAGTISVGATVNAGHIDGAGAHVTVSGGALSVADASSVTELVVAGGTLSGAGTLTATETFRWTNGTLAGSGETVIGPDATGTITLPTGGSQYIDGRTLTNRGTTTWTAGSFSGKNNARIVNAGTFHANADGYYISNYSTNSASFTNTGTVDKTSGSGAGQFNLAFANSATVNAATGSLYFSGGGGNDPGSWTTGASGQINFSGGTFTPSVMSLSGNIAVSNAGNVSAGHVDGAGAHVTVSQGTFGVSDAATVSRVDELVVSGGSLAGAGRLEATDRFRWTNGTLGGSGETIIGPDATGTITLPTSLSQYIDGRTLTNRGTTTWTAGSFSGKNNARILNEGTFHANADSYYISNYSTGSATMRNTGTLDKTAGTGIAQINLPMTNAADVDVETGALLFSFGGGNDAGTSGTWTTSDTGKVSFYAGTFSPDAMTLSGNFEVANAGNVNAGHVDGPDATLTLTQGTFAVRAAAGARRATAGPDGLFKQINLTGGTLDGGGQVEITDKLKWTTGSMAGPGETVIGPDAEADLDLSGTPEIRARTYTNRGTSIWKNGNLRLRDNGGIHNTHDFIANANGYLSQYSTNSGWFRNDDDATLEKLLDNGDTSINVPFVSDSDVRVEHGRLTFSGGDITGEPSGGSWCGIGDGQVVFTSGRTFSTEPVNICGHIEISNGGILNAAAVTGDGDFFISNGALNVTSTSLVSNVNGLHLIGGNLSRAGTIYVNDSFSWTSGNMNGSGQTEILPSVDGTISAIGYVKYEGTLLNRGELTWSGGGLYGVNGAEVRNENTFHANSESGSLATYSGTTARFINTGSFTKATGTGTTSISAQFDNDGSVHADTGKLDFSGGGTPTLIEDELDDPLLCPTPTNPQTGSWGSDGTASVDFSQGCFKLGGSIMTGTVNVKGAKVLGGGWQGLGAAIYATSGTLETRGSASVVQNLYVSGTLTGPGDIRVCGILTWQAGKMTGTGTTEICPGGGGQINPPTGSLTMSARTLLNRGHLTWSSGSLYVDHAGMLDNRGTFSANAESVRLTCGGSSSTSGGPLIMTTSVIDKGIGSGSTDIDCPILNRGRIQPDVGSFDFPHVMNSATGEFADEPGEPTGGGAECAPAPSASDTELGDWIAEIVREDGDPETDAQILHDHLHTFDDPDTGGSGDSRTLVIGETQDRVNDYAQEHGYSVYDIKGEDFGGDQQKQLEMNAQFIRGAMDAGMTIIDLGPDSDRDHLAWWAILEQILIADRQYPTQEVRDPALPLDC